MSLHRGEELALQAMKKEFNLLSKKADRKKAEADEYLSIGSEMLAIHKEFAEVVNSKKTDKATLKKLDELSVRSKRTKRIQKKNFMDLSDNQFKAESDRDDLGCEIQRLEFRRSIR